MARTESSYRALKKKLNKYHKFTFDLPPKGKQLTPQQKSAITRIANKLENYIYRVSTEKASYIPKPKGYSLKEIPQALHTNKGIFYPSPGAQLVLKKPRGKKKKTLHFEVRFKQLIEKYFPFPVRVLGNMEKIQLYVDQLIKKYKPEYVMWAVNTFQGRVRYSPERFNEYQFELFNSAKFRDDFDSAKKQNKNFLTGVFLGFRV